MRGLALFLATAPAIATARPAPAVATAPAVSIDVDVDVRTQEPIAPPSMVAPSALPKPPPPPSRWFSFAGTLGVTSQDHVANDASQNGYGARVEADLIARGSWRGGIAFGRGSDRRFVDGYDYYDGAALDDTRAVAYLQHAARRGRFEARVGGGLGVVLTSVRRWSSRVTSSESAGNDDKVIAELSGLVSIDLVGPLALGIGAVITRFDQRFESWTYDEDRDLHRGIDVSLQSALRWKL